MSCIFKGDSIYKSGGGGGGYKDGGQLVDGDFIKVENNTVSSYDNVSRDPVNFYFEVKDGEILNSSVEFTTQVNTTVNVYYIGSGGLLIPVGYVGSNTANAGDSYNISIIGKSFIIENVTAPNIDPDNINVYDNVDGVIYPCKKINGIYWSLKDHKKYCQYAEIANINYPWRIPTQGEFYSIYNNNAVQDVAAIGEWYNNVIPAPTNSTGLSFAGNGYKETAAGAVQNKLYNGFWWFRTSGGENSFAIKIDENSRSWYFYKNGYTPANYYISLRLIYDP